MKKYLLVYLCLAMNLFGGEYSKDLLKGVIRRTDNTSQVLTSIPPDLRLNGWSEVDCPICEKQGLKSAAVMHTDGGCAVCPWLIEGSGQCARGCYYRWQYLVSGKKTLKRFVSKGRGPLGDVQQWAQAKRQEQTQERMLAKAQRNADDLILRGADSGGQVMPVVRQIPFRRSASFMPSAIAAEVPEQLIPVIRPEAPPTIRRIQSPVYQATILQIAPVNETLIVTIDIDAHGGLRLQEVLKMLGRVERQKLVDTLQGFAEQKLKDRGLTAPIVNVVDPASFLDTVDYQPK